MNKNILQINDIVEFRSGKKATVGLNVLSVLDEYYNDDLTCKSRPEYDIIKIYRPRFELISERDDIQLKIDMEK